MQSNSNDSFQIDKKETDALCCVTYDRVISTDKIPFYCLRWVDRVRPFDTQLPREIDVYFLHGTKKVECTFNVQLDFRTE